jgi:hypothetical protein
MNASYDILEWKKSIIFSTCGDSIIDIYAIDNCSHNSENVNSPTCICITALTQSK